MSVRVDNRSMRHRMNDLRHRHCREIDIRPSDLVTDRARQSSELLCHGILGAGMMVVMMGIQSSTMRMLDVTIQRRMESRIDPMCCEQTSCYSRHCGFERHVGADIESGDMVIYPMPMTLGDCGDYRVSIGKILIERTDADPGFRSHCICGQRLPPILRQYASRRVENCLE